MAFLDLFISGINNQNLTLQTYHKLRGTSKRITSLLFLNIYTLLKRALTYIILFVFKIIDKANSKFDLKFKEALYINWRKPNLNAQQNQLALTLSL